MGIKAVLFDFDGVIADTEKETMKYLKEAFRSLGVELTREEELSYVGTTGQIQTKKILERNHLAMTVEQFFIHRQKFGNYYENGKNISPMPEIVELLNDLKKERIKTAIVSTTISRLILTALNRMKLLAYFDAVVCGDMVNERKPSPEGYRKAMSLLGVNNNECIILEDSPTGIKAAKAAGAFVLGVKCGEIVHDTTQADAEIDDYNKCCSLKSLKLLFGQKV